MKKLKIIFIILAITLLPVSVFAAQSKSSTDTGYLGNDQWIIDSDGDLVPASDSSQDIGASGSEIAVAYFDNIYVEGAATFSGGQTKKLLIPIEDAELDGTSAPAVAQVGTDSQAVFPALQFDADGGVTGDDIAYLHWIVPDGYVVDSARLNVAYSFSTAEGTATDEAQFDFTINAVAEGETLDAAGTALADQSTDISDATADNGKLIKTQFNIEQEAIAVGDLVTIKVAVDESASALANSGTLDVHYFEIEYESTE